MGVQEKQKTLRALYSLTATLHSTCSPALDRDTRIRSTARPLA